MTLPHLDADAIASLVPMADAIEALRACFAAGPSHVERTATAVAGGDFLVMPAVIDGPPRPVAGAKLLMVQPANAGTSRPVIDGTYVLFDAREGRPIATLDGAALTALRTPAVSMIAALALARPQPTSAVVLGSGPQGRGHVIALRTAFPTLGTVTMVRRGERVPHADLVVAATSSAVPVLDRVDVAPGTHVTFVGSYRPERAEASPDLVAASTVTVDERRAAEHEAGDLIAAVAAGRWSWDRVAGDLSDLAAGRLRRRDDAEVTLFKSVGLAVEDLVVARLAAERAGLLT